jgi:cysteine desulfurase
VNTIYLDNSATTPLHPAVADAMLPYLTEIHGNPASAHRQGQRARQALEAARETVAGILDAHPDEVIFTSGATEANNLAVFGLALATPLDTDARRRTTETGSPGRVLVSAIEHPSVLEPAGQLEEQGFCVERLPVDAQGIVELSRLAERTGPDTRLAAVQLANHETGALQPVRQLVQLLGDKVPVHCDAVQAVGKVAVRFHELGVATLAVSAHKFHGPKGIGALLLRRGRRLRPLFWGGHQQQGRRPGTEPVHLAVGMARALELWQQQAEERTAHVRRLARRLLDELVCHAAPVVLNGPEDENRRLPHTLNLSFPGCRAESLLMNLDLAGVACSTGSACSSGSLLPSAVLQAMAVPADRLQSAMRFSLSPLLSEAEIIDAARRIGTVVARLRGRAGR